MSEYQPRPQGGWPAQPPPGGGGRGEYREAGGDRGSWSYDAPGDRRQGARQPRGRRRRWPIVLSVIVVLLLAVLGIGDQVAKSYAEGAIAQKVKSSGLNARPSVTIEGWPFLTQLAAKDIGVIDISANNVTANSGKIAFSFTAKATGVHLSSLSTSASATIDQINGQALVPFSSVAGLIPGGSGATITADPALGPDAVKADLGIAGSVTGTVRQASPNLIVVQLKHAIGLASVLGSLPGNAIDIEIPALPAGLVVRSVRVNSQGIVAQASASHTTLSQ